MKLIDLTHTLTSQAPTWDTSCGFELILTTDYKDCTPPDLFRKQKIKMEAGIGTHMDAPAHVHVGGKTIEKIPLEELVTECIVINLSSEAEADYLIMPSTIEKFEKEHGTIPAGSFVLFYTGWDKYWETPEKYHGDYHFPSVHVSTAELLVSRNIAGLGIDTLSCDRGDTGYPVHRAILGAGKYLVENIANAGSLPATGAKICALPMKIADATEAPLRLIALL